MTSGRTNRAVEFTPTSLLAKPIVATYDTHTDAPRFQRPKQNPTDFFLRFRDTFFLPRVPQPKKMEQKAPRNQAPGT